jgi:serine O-acetyltransferase
MSLRALLAEDFRTHDRDPTQLGFWAIAVHRFGNWRMRLRPRAVRAPFSAAYKLLYVGVTTVTGIDLPYSTKLGRRVRIWHHGGTVVSARAVGDDVHIRHNTTVGVVRRGAPGNELPVIGHRVDIGVGAAILGPVVVADDSLVGSNAVVIRSNRPGETLVGVPARPLREVRRRSAA